MTMFKKKKGLLEKVLYFYTKIQLSKYVFLCQFYPNLVGNNITYTPISYVGEEKKGQFFFVFKV